MLMGSLLKESPLRGKTRRRLWIYCSLQVASLLPKTQFP